MKMPVIRIVIVTLAAEVLGVAALALLVVIFGPTGGIAEAQPFAERLGAWVGPISGFALCLAGGFWVARSVSMGQLRYGLLMGMTAAILDLAVAAALGAQLSALLVFSNLGRIAGGTIGGLIARSRFRSLRL